FSLVGLFLNLLTLLIMLSNGIRGWGAFLVFALGLLFVGGVAGFLIRQLSRLITTYQNSNRVPAQERIIIKEAQAPRLGLTNDPCQAVGEQASVVEHTTRRMADVYVEPKAQG